MNGNAWEGHVFCREKKDTNYSKYEMQYWQQSKLTKYFERFNSDLIRCTSGKMTDVTITTKALTNQFE